MRKELFKLFTRCFAIAAILTMVICGISCASTSGTPDDNVVEIDTTKLLGSWAWDYGYNQEAFANEQITFKKDKSFEIFHITSQSAEWDYGNYYFINDPKQGLTLVINITSFKNGQNSELENVDVKIYFAVHGFTENELIMSRYKRDMTAMGWITIDSDPAIYNEFHKIKDGTKENLIGSWKFNKNSRPDTNWDESWTFNDDNTIQVVCIENDSTETYKGTYTVEKGKTGVVLHQTLTHLNDNDTGFKEINPPMEFWYDYTICSDNLINVKTIKDKVGGKEHPYTPSLQNFYYRDIPLETVTYHWVYNTFTDNYPVGTEYETLDLSKRYLFTGVNNNLLDQKLEGWYDNSELKGEPVTKIATNDTNKHEYWAKWSLYCNKSTWINDNTKKEEHNHEFNLPLSILMSYSEAPASLMEKFPEKGQTIPMLLSGKISDNYKGWIGLRLVDQSDGWFEIANDWHYAEINKGEFTHLFELKMLENARTTDMNKIELNLCYNPEYLDESRVISDFSFEYFDVNSSDIIEHNFNYGGFTFKNKAAKGHDYYLPHPNAFQNVPWQMYNQDFVDWYDNPEFKGNPVKVLSAQDNTKPKNFYGKFNLVFGAAAPTDDGGFYSNTNFFVKSVIPDAKINPKAGNTVKLVVKGTLSKDYEGRVGMDLHNVAGDNWVFLGNDWHFISTKDKKFETFFEIKIRKDADFNSIDDALFLLALNPKKKGEVYKLNDVKIEFADEDPFVTTQAATKYVSIKPCELGFEVTVTKPDSDTGDWQGNFDFYHNENVQVPGTFVDGRFTNVSIETRYLNQNKTVTFIWPFCEKGKVYNFEYTWTDSKNKWHGENIKVLATTGSGEFYYKPLDNIDISFVSNKKETNLIVSNFTIDNILKAVGKHIDMVDSVRVEFPFISGKNDWSNTDWLFGSSCDIYPTFNENDTFYNELLTKGKSNIFGDHNFWWGDKYKINEALSKHSEMWTDLRIHMHVKGNPDYVNSWIQTNRTQEFPFTPAKF